MKAVKEGQLVHHPARTRTQDALSGHPEASEIDVVSNRCLLRQHVQATGQDGRRYEICTLTSELAEVHAESLVALHNLIPYVRWTERELLAEVDRLSGREYYGKWSFSLCAFHDGDPDPVALLIAYIRKDNVKSRQAGLYIHRLAVAVEHQRNRLGTHMMEAAIEGYFGAVPGLEVVTVQTNDELNNQGVIRFYRSLGFEDYGKVEYPNKLDILLHVRQPLRAESWRVHRPSRPPEVEVHLNRTAEFLEYISTLVTPQLAQMHRDAASDGSVP